MEVKQDPGEVFQTGPLCTHLSQVLCDFPPLRAGGAAQSTALSGCLHSSGSGKNPILHLGDTKAQMNQAKSCRSPERTQPVLPAQKSCQIPLPVPNASSHIGHKPEMGPVWGHFTPSLWKMHLRTRFSPCLVLCQQLWATCGTLSSGWADEETETSREDVAAFRTHTFRQVTSILCGFMMCTRQGAAHQPTLQPQR